MRMCRIHRDMEGATIARDGRDEDERHFSVRQHDGSPG